MSQSGLQIGEVARRAAVSIDTIRYYERRKLLPRSPRSEGGFRLFSSETVRLVRFIKEAQEMGLSLGEIKELMTNGGAPQCKRVRDLLRAKIADLDERMTKLRRFKRTLSQQLASCESELRARGPAATCPLVTNLLRKDQE